jgi:hypothetical protein
MPIEDYDPTTETGRFLFLLNKIWAGSRTRMARDIGVTQSAISNVATGRQRPGRKILALLAAHPLVDPGWLLTGQGNPLMSDAPVGEASLPIAAQPFNGLPMDHPDALEASSYPVPKWLFRDSRYWSRVDAQSPFAEDGKLRIAVGDMLLWEPDPKNWPDDIRGKPLLARIEGDRKGRMLYCRSVSSTDGHGNLDDFEFYGQLQKVARRSRRAPEDDQETNDYWKDLWAIDLSTPSPSGDTAPDHDPAAGLDAATIRVVTEAVAVFRCGPCS